MLSGQHTIQSSDTTEKAADFENVSGEVIRVKNTGDNKIYIGGQNVDDTSGFSLDSGKKEAVRIVGLNRTGEKNLHVYGTSGDTIEWIVVA